MRSCPLSRRILDLKMLQAPLTGCFGAPHGHHTSRQHDLHCRPDRHPARRQCHTQVIQSACWLLCASCTQHSTPPHLQLHCGVSLAHPHAGCKVKPHICLCRTSSCHCPCSCCTASTPSSSTFTPSSSSR